MQVAVAHQVCRVPLLQPPPRGVPLGHHRLKRVPDVQPAHAAALRPPCRQVNAHLNSEVERLTLAAEALAAEKAALETRVRHLSRMLVDARARLPEAAAAAAAAAEAAARAEVEEEAAAAELQSDAFEAANSGGAQQAA